MCSICDGGNTLKKLLLVTAAFIALPGAAQAAVIVNGNVAGLGTFKDTNTGSVWLRFDNFFNQTSEAMFDTAVRAGFTIANEAQVRALLDTLPLAGNWSSYASIMGRAPNRDLIWGSFGPVDAGQVGWAYAYSGDAEWQYNQNIVPSNEVPNGGSDAADMNVWAFQTGAGRVPEPAAWAMMLAGFGLVGSAMRRRSKVAVTFA